MKEFYDHFYKVTRKVIIFAYRKKIVPMAKVYVASSWRNPYQPEVVARLREAGHDVYDFRNPEENPGGFHWADIDEKWLEWTAREYIDHLDHPIAEKGFSADFRAME